jgi:hypothetical protein
MSGIRTHGHGLRASEEKARYRSATVTGFKPSIIQI